MNLIHSGYALEIYIVDMLLYIVGFTDIHSACAFMSNKQQNKHRYIHEDLRSHHGSKLMQIKYSLRQFSSFFSSHS